MLFYTSGHPLEALNKLKTQNSRKKVHTIPLIALNIYIFPQLDIIKVTLQLLIKDVLLNILKSFVTSIILISSFSALAKDKAKELKVENDQALKREITVKKETVHIIEHFPNNFIKTKPYPFVIIASSNEDMMSAFDGRFAAGLKRMGFVVLRFNWPYFSNGTKPSKSFSKESQLFTDLVNGYKKKAYIDKTKMFLISKDTGSYITNFSIATRSFKGIVLVNPKCGRSFFKFYKNIDSIKAPIHLMYTTKNACGHKIIAKDLPLFKSTVTLFTSSKDFTKAVKTNNNILQNGAIYSGLTFLNDLQ